MLAAEPGEHLPRWFRATCLYVGQSALNPFDRLDAVEQGLVSLRVLHHQLRLAVDRQNEGMAGLPKAIQEIDRVALEVAERTDVVGKVEHVGPIKSASNLM